MRTAWDGSGRAAHYYEEEPAAVTAVVDAVLAAGARRLLVGHGGPLDAAAVAAWRARRRG